MNITKDIVYKNNLDLVVSLNRADLKKRTTKANLDHLFGELCGTEIDKGYFSNHVIPYAEECFIYLSFEDLFYPTSFVFLTSIDKETLYINLVCASSNPGKGYGKKLLYVVEEYAKDHGYSQLRLEPATKILVSYYTELGYIQSKNACLNPPPFEKGYMSKCIAPIDLPDLSSLTISSPRSISPFRKGKSIGKKYKGKPIFSRTPSISPVGKGKPIGKYKLLSKLPIGKGKGSKRSPITSP